MARLLVLTPGELTRDPRGRRSALAAAARGYEVVGICPETADEAIPLEDVRVVRVPGEKLTPRLNRLGLGGMERKPGPLLRELRGAFRLLRLARLSILTVREGRKLPAAEVVHAHEVDMLPAALLLRRGGRLVYDAHEIYASAEPDPPRLYRGITTWLERVIARRADAVVTVSDAIAHELESSLGLRRRPAVTLNCPSVVADVSLASSPGRLRAIYQGAMGPGRLLGDLFAAAERATDTELTIRVSNLDLEQLRREVRERGLADRIVVLDPVSPTSLVEALAGYDVGLIINRPTSRNDELVFPNKLFEYMMAGLAVVVPALPTLAAFVDENAIGVTFPPGDAAALGEALGRLAADRPQVERMRRTARSLALERFNAELQEATLQRLWDPA